LAEHISSEIHLILLFEFDLNLPMSQNTQETKRRRTSTKPFDWRVTISTPQTFKTLLAIVQPTVAHVPFQVCMNNTETTPGASFTGLRMDAMNNSHVCMVKTAYECQVETSTTLRNESFCVETDTFMTLMRDVQASHVVELIRYTDSVELTIQTYERADSNNWSISTIQMVDEDADFNELDMWSLTFNYVVEIELERLKEVCRIIHAIRGNVIEFKVEEPSEQESKDGERHHYFTIAAENEGASTRKIHHSSTVSDGGPDAIKVLRGNQVEGDDEERGEMVERYSGTFPAMYLNGVLKSMDRQTVQLYLGPGLPLVLHYGLGGDTSYIKIILAARLADV
jgi:hypothetical protein